MKWIFAFVLSAFIVWPSFGQPNKIVGNWEGKLTGTNLRLIFHITEREGQFNTKMDSPDQGASGIPFDKTVFSDGKLVINLTAAAAYYEGILGDDGAVRGKWNQRGASIILDLIRKEENEKPEVKPQTPQPPYSYQSEDIEYDNIEKSIHFGATFTYPKGEGTFPVAILITGSGGQDRDETLGAHKPFAVIADYLTKNGIAVLRVDDRGMGKTTGDTKTATSVDFAKDVESALAYLKTRKEINVRKIGLIGHSEGGVIGPMVASRNKDIAFVVLLAGPGIPIADLMVGQSEAILRTGDLSEVALKSYLSLYKKMIVAIPKAPSEEEASKSATKIFSDWQKVSSSDIVKATTGVADSIAARKFVERFVGQLYSPWFRFFLQYNPQPTLQKLNSPVLALNGEKDVQVIAKSNLAGIAASLKKNKKNNIQELPGLNHLFQTCKTCSPNEYFSLEETFSPKALEVMTGWLKKVVK